MDILNEISVIFSLPNASEELYIVGSCEALGNWNPNLGIRLFPVDSISSATYPIKLLKQYQIQYKYIKKGQSGWAWESIPNRKLCPQSNVYVRDAFNSYTSSLDYCQKRFEAMRRNSSEIRLEKLQNGKCVIIIASMNLPVRVARVDNEWVVTETNSSWQSQLFSVVKEELDFLWIGYPGVNIPLEDQPLVCRILENYRCIPVFIPDDTLKYHSSYCEKVLFNTLNNTIDLVNPASSERNPQQWEGYKMLNILFNEVLFSVFNGQMIWVHGSELFLLPSFICRKIKDPVHIGFYMHRPFPSSEIFRILPHKLTILNALCCCKVIGFQIFEYANHFIGTCRKIMNVRTRTSKDGFTYLNYFGRNITIYISHIGISPQKIVEVQQGCEYKKIVKELKEEYAGRAVILSIDIVAPLTGITLKLKAVENLVINRKLLLDDFVFLQILIPNSEFDDICAHVIQVSEDINKRLNKNIIKTLVKEITHSERFAYMEISSGLVVGTIREGLCLLPYEYLLIKRYNYSGIVLSEFAGASRTLNTPFKVNPFDVGSFETGIFNLFKYIPNKSKLDRDLNYVNTKTASFWMKDFISQISSSFKSSSKFQYVSIGMNDTLRVIAIPKVFTKLDDYEVLQAYKSTSNRVLFFDVEGTLLNFIKDSETYTPSAKIILALEELCSDPKNTIVAITGRERPIMHQWFSNVKNLNMAAEYGAYLKMYSEEWECFANSSDWREISKKIIESHCQRIEGSSMIIKESSVMFSYKEADCGFGQWQAKELVSYLESLLNCEECEVFEGENYVEVRPRGIDKGTTLYRILQKVYKVKGKIDFMFIIGDDDSDERTFKMVKLLKKRRCEYLDLDVKSFTCTFGLKPSEAINYFLNADEVIKLMELLSTNSCKRAHSLGTLTGRHSINYYPTVSASFLRIRRGCEAENITNFL